MIITYWNGYATFGVLHPEMRYRAQLICYTLLNDWISSSTCKSCVYLQYLAFLGSHKWVRLYATSADLRVKQKSVCMRSFIRDTKSMIIHFLVVTVPRIKISNRLEGKRIWLCNRPAHASNNLGLSSEKTRSLNITSTTSPHLYATSAWVGPDPDR